MKATLRPASWHPADFEPITIEREKTIPAPPRNEYPTRKLPAMASPTRRMERIDPNLLALARGDAEVANDNPFGGLVPLRDGDLTDWRSVNAKVVADLEQIVSMPLGPLESFLLIHLDGSIDIEELCRLACASEDDVISALDELEWVGIVSPNV